MILRVSLMFTMVSAARSSTERFMPNVGFRPATQAIPSPQGAFSYWRTPPVGNVAKSASDRGRPSNPALKTVLGLGHPNAGMVHHSPLFIESGPVD
jgi:hypothetical protein